MAHMKIILSNSESIFMHVQYAYEYYAIRIGEKYMHEYNTPTYILAIPIP